MPSPEQSPEISVYQGNSFEAEISETTTTFTTVVRTRRGDTAVFRYSPPGDMSFQIVSSAPSLSPAPETVADDRQQIAAGSPETEAPPETEKTVKIYGRS